MCTPNRHVVARSQVVFIQYLTFESTPTGIVLRFGKKRLLCLAQHNLLLKFSWRFRTLLGVVLLCCLLDSRARSGSKLVLAYIADNYHRWVIR